MLLIFYDPFDETYFAYKSQYDSSKEVGLTNNFGDICVGIFVYDIITNHLVSYLSSFDAELFTKLNYNASRFLL